jgi:NTE family protein
LSHVPPEPLRRPQPPRVDLDGDIATPTLDVLRSLDRPYRPPDLEGRPKIGLVFGAGGVQGNAYLAGVVAAIREASGFEPRTAAALVGTSAGSVHAALYGAGMPALFGLWRNRGGRIPGDLFIDRMAADTTMEAPSPTAEWRDRGEEGVLRDIFTPARVLPRIGPSSRALAARTLLRPFRYRPEIVLAAWLPEGVLTNVAIGQALQRIVPSGWVHHPRTWIVAVNLRTGRREVFGMPGAPRAHLDRAVRASCAIPALYRPVRIGRDRYVDGGVHSPSNADLIAGLDLDLAIVINPMSSLEGHAAAGWIDRNLYRFRHYVGRRLTTELRDIHDPGIPVLVVQPTADDLSIFSRNLMDPRPRRLIAERAVATTRELLRRDEVADVVSLLRVAAAAAA